MPLPPLTSDYYVVGGAGISTWGKLRCTLGNQAQNFTASTYAIDFLGGFKSAEGNGFLRLDFDIALIFYRQPPFVYVSGSQFYLENADLYGMISNEDRDQLIGEDVTVTGGSGPFAMTSAAFDTSGGQTPGVGGSDPILTIGKLTSF
jgi:hypothetical protein